MNFADTTTFPRFTSGYALKALALGGAVALALTACASGADAGAESSEPATASSGEAMDDEAMDKDDSMEHDASGDSSTDADEAMDKDAMEEEPAEDRDVPAELQFTAATLGGGTIEGASLAGKDTIIWAWASWCPVCQAEAPDVAAASMKLPEGVILYGLPGKADEASSDSFVANYGLDNFDHIFDEEGSLWSGFGVSYQPAFVLINDDGTIEVISGSLDEEGILEAAEELANA